MKRLLLISPVLYGIEKHINDALQKKGFEVTWIENKILPFDYQSPDAKLRSLRRTFYALTFKKEQHIKKQLSTIDNLNFDVLLSINCHVLCSCLIRKLRNRNKNIKTILYLWDSTNKFSCLKTTELFDRVYTFDHDDSKKHNWDYIPNFFIKNEDSQNKNHKYDLLFVGKFTEHRLKLLDEIIDKQLVSRPFKYYIKLLPAYKNSLHSYLLYLAIKRFREKNKWICDYTLNYEAITRKLNHEYLIYKPVSPETVVKKRAQSKVIIDLPFPDQSGYTHNAIAALALGKKLITTNNRIRNEEFYNPDQVKIIDQNNPEVDYSWIKEKGEFSIHPYFEKLEMSNWLSLIVNGNKAS